MRKLITKFIFILPIVALLLLSLSLILFSFWYALYRTEPKQINLFNLLPYEIQIEYLGRKLLVNPFEVTNLELNTAETFEISFASPANNYEKKITITDLSNYKEIVYITLDKNNSNCYIDGLVNATTKDLEYTKVISKVHMDYYVTKFKDYQNLSFVPQVKLGDFIQNRVIFPAPCDLENKLENYQKIWDIFIDYNAEEQMNYYLDNLNKINSTNNIEELNNLK